MRDGSLVSSVTSIKSIEITMLPTKTTYMHGEYFDTTGMVVTATCQNGFTMQISDYTYPTTYLTNGTTSVEISYVKNGTTCIASVPVIVNAFDPATVLVDFSYTANTDGTYTLNTWKQTYNGKASTEMIIPNYGCIIV